MKPGAAHKEVIHRYRVTSLVFKTAAMALAQQGQVYVVEEASRTDRTCCARGEKQYRVRSGDGATDLFLAKEQLDCCCQKCLCLCRRDFDISFEDKTGDPVTMNHLFMCCSWFHCCLPCCRHRLTVSRKNEKLGRIQSDCSCCCTCFPSFTVYDHTDKEIYSVSKDMNCCAHICGNCGCCNCCAIPVGYTIHGKNGLKDAVIDEISTGVRKDQTFLLKYPQDADENHRVLLLGVSFLIDYALYEDGRGNDPKTQNMK